MPFTLSHAGFVAPLRQHLSSQLLLALMIGSIVPDFGYFIRAFGIATFAHTMAGAVCVSLPLGLIVHLTLDRISGRVISQLPRPHADFMATWDLAWRPAWKCLPQIALAILTGALSHNFVDSFTHESGVAVALFPVLSRDVLTIHGEPYPVFRALQYAGSIAGLVILLGTYLYSLRSYCQPKHLPMWQDRRRWIHLLGLVGITILIATVMNGRSLVDEPSLYAARAFAFQFLITWIPLFGLAFLGHAILRRRPGPVG